MQPGEQRHEHSKGDGDVESAERETQSPGGPVPRVHRARALAHAVTYPRRRRQPDGAVPTFGCGHARCSVSRGSRVARPAERHVARNRCHCGPVRCVRHPAAGGPAVQCSLRPRTWKAGSEVLRAGLGFAVVPWPTSGGGEQAGVVDLAGSPRHPQGRDAVAIEPNARSLP
jgi:hypothetical protein